jgi:predicted RNase H-like HicB family nuclease
LPCFQRLPFVCKSIDEALVNIKEVIDICLEEEKEKVSGTNRFVGFREMKVSVKAASV